MSSIMFFKSPITTKSTVKMCYTCIKLNFNAFPVSTNVNGHVTHLAESDNRMNYVTRGGKKEVCLSRLIVKY